MTTVTAKLAFLPRYVPLASPRYGRRPVWTEAEEDVLRREYNGERSISDHIALKLGRSFNGVKGHAAKLGLVRLMKAPAWTEREIAILNQEYDRLSPQSIKRQYLPKRSLTAIIVKLKRLHLSRRTRDGWYTKLEACELLGVDHKKVQDWIDRGELAASYHHETKPQKNGIASWHIEAAALRQFVIRCARELTGRNVDLVGLVELLTDA